MPNPNELNPWNRKLSRGDIFKGIGIAATAVGAGILATVLSDDQDTSQNSATKNPTPRSPWKNPGVPFGK